jgi:hypothetical protein
MYSGRYSPTGCIARRRPASNLSNPRSIGNHWGRRTYFRKPTLGGKVASQRPRNANCRPRRARTRRAARNHWKSGKAHRSRSAPSLPRRDSRDRPWSPHRLRVHSRRYRFRHCRLDPQPCLRKQRSPRVLRPPSSSVSSLFPACRWVSWSPLWVLTRIVAPSDGAICRARPFCTDCALWSITPGG